MPLDLSDDYRCVDLYEAVTITSRATAPTLHSEEVEVARAFRRKLSYRELAASAGAAIRMETAIDVPMALTPDYTWKPGDTLTDSNDNTYNIYIAESDPTTAFWSFVLYNPKIAYDLRHVVNWYDHDKTKDASGASYSEGLILLYEDICSRVQWTTATPAKYADRTGEERRAIIYSSQRLFLKHDSIARWQEPETDIDYIFDVENWTMTERLDELMQIAVVARP